MRRVCTIIARNYWAHARVLARSLRVHHPDVKLEVFVVDGDERTLRRAERELFDVLNPEDVGLDLRELHRMAAIYDLLELATAVKPWFLLHLLNDAEAVVYLDPDIEVFAPLDPVWELASEHGIVVTPHTTRPLPTDPGGPDELSILKSGVYNLGFIAVGRRARPFVEWWRDRLRRDALIAKEAGMFVDQRWVDLAPSYFHVHILREPGWNVAYWNLPVRDVTRVGESYTVDGEPLRFFHFSGFDPDRPDILSCYEGDPPRTNLERHPHLAELCRQYADALIGAGYRSYSRVEYGFGSTADGLPLDRYARRLYRRELMDAEASNSAEPPDPFDGHGAARFAKWLSDPAGAYPVTRYMRGIYDERGDLQAFYPDLGGRDGRHFMDWARNRARLEPNVEPQLVDLATRRHRRGPPGVNLIGYFSAESGVGEVARLMQAALAAGGVPTALVPFTKTSSRQRASGLESRFEPPQHDTNVICVNADALEGLVDDMGDELLSGRRNVGVWQWELERFPEWMARTESYIDEIWVSSEHAAKAVRAQATKPVYVVPLPILRPIAGTSSRADLGVDDRFTFLFCFDFDSVFERKNPLGIIEAFFRAFPPGSGPQLLIKSVRGDAHPSELGRLVAAAAGSPDVKVLDGYLDARAQAALVSACDAYVSLHRAEGFGLTIAEAMACGKPVVATAYSGNLEFMDETNSWLVPFDLVSVPEGCDPYPAGARWASPDLDAAAAAMRAIIEDPAEASARARRAAEDVDALHGPQARARLILRRVHDIPAVDPGIRWSPLESAEQALRCGPDVGSPTKYGGLSRFVRKIVLRIARHYVEHEEKVQSSLLEGMRALHDRLETEGAATRALEVEVRALTRTVEEEIAKRRELSERLRSPAPAEFPAPHSMREQRIRSYAGLFGTQAPVVAVGAAASDVTSLLSAHGVRVFTLDSAQTRAGPRVDAILEGLRGLGDHSLGGILTLHVLEHLSGTDLQHFLEVSRRKLAAGGVLVAETGECRGLTHDLPGSRAAMAPQALLELCRSTGFEQAYVLFPTGASSGTEADAGNGDFAIVAAVLLPTSS